MRRRMLVVLGLALVLSATVSRGEWRMRIHSDSTSTQWCPTFLA